MKQHSLIRYSAILLFLNLVLTISARAENWTEFRGPSGDGHTTAKNLPVKWSQTENVTWKTALPGHGWSSPILWENRIFLTTAVPPEDAVGREQSLRTLCFDADTGEELWKREIFFQTDEETYQTHPKNSHASGTPITDGKYLYVHFGPEGTACLTLEGEAVWKNEELRFDPRHGTGGSPIIVDDLLIFNCDGYEEAFIVALDRYTGKVKWRTERPPHDRMQKFAFSTPTLIKVGKQRQIISPGAYVVGAYAPEDGHEIWRAHFDGFSIVPRPVYAHNYVYMSTSFLSPTLLQISPDGKGDVTQTHLNKSDSRAVPETPSMLIVGKYLYMVSDDGIISCLDAVNGKRQWKKRIPGNYSASPLYGDGNIYFTSEKGICTVIKAGPKYKKVATSHLEERTFASFAVYGSSLIIRGEENLYRIDKP